MEGHLNALLIEDDANDALLMQEMLSGPGEGQTITLTVRASLRDGLDCLKRAEADVVLLDLTLPDSHGLETFIRIHASAPDVPVVIVTGFDDAAIGLEAVHLGAQDYLVKDRVDAGVLRKALRYAIERQLLQQRLLEMRQREQQLRIEKLESLGVLAGGIAHDFNNLLTGILGNIELAGMAQTLEDARQMLTGAQQAAVRATALTRQLLTFSKGGDPVTEIASVASLLEEASSFAVRGANVKCDFDIEEGLSAAEIDRGQMAQVFQNIVINAVQSMPEGGVIHVHARNVVFCADDAAPAKPGRYIHIAFQDEGNGIPPRYLSKIFDPYFTTKQTGSGLGLATAYSIVQKHQGAMTVDSQLGAGSTFHIYLPACSGRPRADEYTVPLSAQSGRILVVDDEAPVRDLTAAYLHKLGFECRAVADGAAALQAYRDAKDTDVPFAAVIVDLTIPGGMGGEELIGRLLEVDPAVRAIVSSGYSTHSVMSNYRDYGFRGVVPKPYRLDALRHALHAVLSEVRDEQTVTRAEA